MRIAGIVAEYNPFHNGHKFHLEQVKKLTGADYVIVVISGDFTQRGAPALLSKYMRAEMALRNGADLVLELPIYYAAGSAEYFAMGAVSLLDKLGVVNAVCFGSESGNLQLLQQTAGLLIDEPEAFKSAIREYLKTGCTYPQARSLAVSQVYPESDTAALLSSPNNILGIEYLKALTRRNSSIEPFTIKRVGSSYNDASLRNEFSSALAIRTALLAGNELSVIKNQVPENVYDLMTKNYLCYYPVFSNDLSSLLKYKLLLDYHKGFTQYMDISKEFSDKIKNSIHDYTDFDGYCNLLKTKDITYTRISRGFLHILLNMTKDNMERFTELDYTPYARMLGFNKSSTDLLNAIKRNSEIPLLSKLADAKTILDKNELSMLAEDIQAAHIYNAIVTDKFGVQMKNEFTKNIVIV